MSPWHTQNFLMRMGLMWKLWPEGSGQACLQQAGGGSPGLKPEQAGEV